MRVPLSWLRDFAPFPAGDPAALAEQLDDLGLLVEGWERVGEGLGDVIVARVDRIDPIAGADRIRLVTVEAGDGPLEIVCGASNFVAGDLVPLAPIGAVLPGGFEIARRTMKGAVSHGMLCSGRELGLSDDHQGLLVLTEVDGARPGQRVAELLGIAPDVVFDLAVEGNRPDAWSMAGVARDLAARLGLPAPRYSVSDSGPDHAKRFVAGVSVGSLEGRGEGPSKKQAERAEARRTQIGSGDRSERIRTYNFPQNRVTDHRINLTLYKLETVIQGDLEELVGALKLSAREQYLKVKTT